MSKEYEFAYQPSNLEILVISDVCIDSISKLTEYFIKNLIHIDVIFLCGPFNISLLDSDHSNDNNREMNSISHADIGTIISLLENIVCRIIYLANENDSIDIITQQLYLTPNSCNIYGRRINLLCNDKSSLYVTGFTERSDNLGVHDIKEENEISDEIDIPSKNSSMSSISIIQELLTTEFNSHLQFSEETIELYNGKFPNNTTNPILEKNENDFGIFLFHYKYAHSLSYFLFHMTDIIETSKIQLVIIPTIGRPEAERLPSTFGKFHIVTPRSLKSNKSYTIIHLKSNKEMFWHVDKIDNCIL